MATESEKYISNVKANLNWVEQQWEAWLESEVGQKVVRHPSTIRQHSEHVAKLFAAFCVEELVKDKAQGA